MMMLTVTPNPALDVNGDVEEIIPNEKTYVTNERRHPGGNGINAARVVTALGFPVTATGFLGGCVGNEMRELLDREKVHHDFVTIAGQTRINMTVSSEKTGKQTRLSFPGPHVTPDEIAALRRKIDGYPNLGVTNIGGSCPPGFGHEEIVKLIEVLHAKDLCPIIDVPSKALRGLIPCKPLMIKPNLHEFQSLVEKGVERVEGVVREAERLLETVALVCVSSVEGGTVFVARTGAWYAKGERVKAKSSVGAGDSMVGAIMTQLHAAGIVNFRTAQEISDQTVADLLQTALAAALATVERPGTEVGDKESVERHRKAISVKKLRGG